MTSPKKTYCICAFYQFVSLARHEALQKPLLALMNEHQVKGTLLLAPEGINGVLAARESDLQIVLQWLRAQPEFAEMPLKFSESDSPPFRRAKVKLKKEIVTMGMPIDPSIETGDYVDAKDWNAVIDDPDVLLLDARNEYEVEVGTFAGAVNPHLQTFREFPAFAEKHLQGARDKKIAMFCTGGIRCEKSTAWLKQHGFQNVVHLRGGILQYLNDTPRANSRWRGECFVFDDRVTVTHNLTPGDCAQCHACRAPLRARDLESAQYVAGKSCPRCYDKKT